MAVCKDMDSNNPFRGAAALGNSARFGGRICFRTTTGGAKGPIAERTCIKPLLKLRTITTGPAGSIVERTCAEPVLELSITVATGA